MAAADGHEVGECFAQAEPSLASQFWRTMRTIGSVFILVTCLGTLLDDKGLLGKGLLMNNPDIKPQHTSNTKFADVKGVDEAKQELVEVSSDAFACVKHVAHCPDDA